AVGKHPRPLHLQESLTVFPAIFFEQEDGHYRIRLRSKGPFINELAKKHQGGGHPLASGAKARDEQEIKEVVSQLDELAANA
ncbi:MAG: hypothetical protein HUJ64_09205, partial [Limosilactobacillus mucosae]|nr:hypothetical protein [Limosilactobacillus mucosae]